jgi:hypothetical protein
MQTIEATKPRTNQDAMAGKFRQRHHSQMRAMAVAVFLFMLSSALQAAMTVVPKPALAAAQKEIAAHYASVDPANLDEARDEIAYIRSITTPREQYINNLADDRQLRFTLRNLKKAGRTPQNAPQLFATIAHQRARHKQNPPASDALVDAPAPGDQRLTINMIVDLGPVANTPLTYTTTGLSTVPGGTMSTLAMVQLFDASQNTPIGSGGSDQQFGEGTNLTAMQTSAAAQAVPNLGAYLQVSYQANVTSDPVTVTVQTASDGIPVAPPTVMAPIHVYKGVPPNPFIKVCLSRSDADPNCDYGPFQFPPTGNPIVQLPVSGSISYNANVDTTRTISGLLYIWAKDGGGGCKLNLSPSQFANAFKPNGKQLTWAFNNANFGLLNYNPCWQSGQLYGMMFDVFVPLVGTVPFQEFFITTVPGPSLPNATRIDPLKFTFGCFAAGTRVLMADGSTKAIEHVKIGDAVIADASGRRLTVRDTTEGTEFPPMVIITDAAGHTLSITEGHAVVIRDGSRTRVVLAKELKLGDVVFTSDMALENGRPRNFKPSRIVKIDRQKDDGHVYNLYLGIRENGERFDTSDTTLIAGGILTGDNAMQEFYGADFNFKPKNVKDRLSREWHRDYENHLQEQKRRANAARGK